MTSDYFARHFGLLHRKMSSPSEQHGKSYKVKDQMKKLSRKTEGPCEVCLRNCVSPECRTLEVKLQVIRL